MLKLRSSISSDLKRKTLFRGSMIAFMGLIFLCIAYFYVSEATLEQWGWAFYLWGLFFIIWGMLPYRKLMKIEDLPFELWVSDSQVVHFGKNGHSFWHVPVNKITSISYQNDPAYYGITLMEDEKKHFCPYLSKRSFEELQTFLHS